MKDVQGLEIKVGDKLAITGRKYSTGSHLYFATVLEAGHLSAGRYPSAGLLLRLDSCGRRQHARYGELSGRALILGRAPHGVAVVLAGATAPVYVTRCAVVVYRLGEAAGGETETTEAQAEG